MSAGIGTLFAPSLTPRSSAPGAPPNALHPAAVARLPFPPDAATLRASEPAWARLPEGSLCWRIFPRAGHFPSTWSRFRTWGPSVSRFDPHLPDAKGRPHEQARGVLYAAADAPTCFAEYFQRTRVIDRTADAATLVGFRLERPLLLLDLWDAWATRAGASGALSSGRHDVTRAWARALYEVFPEAAGIRYESVMHPGHAAFALFERAAPALPESAQLHRALADPDLTHVVHNAARRFGFEVV
jgi:RES domain